MATKRDPALRPWIKSRWVIVLLAPVEIIGLAFLGAAAGISAGWDNVKDAWNGVG